VLALLDPVGGVGDAAARHLPTPVLVVDALAHLLAQHLEARHAERLLRNLLEHRGRSVNRAFKSSVL
jgi:hypothetical protein